MPYRVCAEAGCPNFATKRGRCDEHRKAKERDRSRARREDARERNRLYARKRWALTRRRKLFIDPICEECDMRLAEEVHHRIPLQAGGDPYALEGLVSLCKPCHSRQTRRESNSCAS